MANLPREGTFAARIINAEAGPDDKGVFTVSATAQLTEGPDEGARLRYSQRVDARSAPYIKRDLTAIGWTGSSLEDLAKDVETWILATGGTTTVEIVHQPYTDKKTGEPRVFAKIRSLGRGAKPLGKPTATQLREANKTMRDADIAPANTAADDESIPF